MRRNGKTEGPYAFLCLYQLSTLRCVEVLVSMSCLVRRRISFSCYYMRSRLIAKSTLRLAASTIRRTMLANMVAGLACIHNTCIPLSNRLIYINFVHRYLFLTTKPAPLSSLPRPFRIRAVCICIQGRRKSRTWCWSSCMICG